MSEEPTEPPAEAAEPAALVDLDLDLSLVDATRRAVAAEPRLRDPRFHAAVVNLMRLARKIDAWDQIVEWALEDVAGKGRGGRPAVPQNDNVSASAYAKQLEQLGLTPTGRKALGRPIRDFNEPERETPATAADEKGGVGGGAGGKVSKLDAYRGQASAAR